MKKKINKIAKQMAPTDQESYHDNRGVTQNTMDYMADGGDVKDKEIDETHDEATAAALKALVNRQSAASQLQNGQTGSPVKSQWDDPEYIRQRALNPPQVQTAHPVDAEGYTTYADGGDVEPDSNDIHFNLSGEDTKALTDYLDADKQRQARINAIQRLGTEPMLSPDKQALVNNMMQGMTMGGIEDVGKDAFTEAAPIAKAGFQKLKNYMRPVAQETAESALLQNQNQPSVAATPQSVEAARQNMNNLMMQHENAYWHPAVKKAIDKYGDELDKLRSQLGK